MWKWETSKETNKDNLVNDWIAKENVKDIQSNLSALKWEIYNKVKNSDKKDEYLGPKFTENQELFNKSLDEQFKSIDHNAESLFDVFARTKKDKLNEIIMTTDNILAKKLLKDLETEFENYLFNSSDMKDTFNAMKALAEDAVKFELNDLRAEINAGNTGNEKTSESARNAFEDGSNTWKYQKNTSSSEDRNSEDKVRKSFDGNVADASEYINTRRANIGVQYTADYYGNIDFDETVDDVQNNEDKKALKKLLKGNNEALDIVDIAYKTSWADKAATKLLTRILLRLWDRKASKQEISTDAIIASLKKVIEAYNDWTDFTMNKWWRKKAKEYGKDEYKLGVLYQISRDNIQWYPYLKRVMDLLVQEFAREDIPEEGWKDFSDIYNEHNNMPTSKQLDLVSRKWQAIRAIETWSVWERQQIRKLLRLAEDIDIGRLMAAIPKDKWEEGGNVFLSNLTTFGPGLNLTNKEKDFVAFCKKNKDNENFTYVLEWLMSGMTIQELANAGKINIPINGEEEAQEQSFIARFSDVNFDGKNDFWDKDMVKWLQFKNIYQEVIIQMHYDGKPQNQALINILTFGKQLAENIGNTTYVDKLDTILETPTFAEINSFFNNRENIPLLKFLQKSLLESPLPASDIVQYGIEAYQNFYNNSLGLPERWKTKIDNHIKLQLTSQGINPDVDFDPVTKEWLRQAITSFIGLQASGAGIGTSLNIWNLADAGNPALDYFLDGLDINIWVAGTTNEQGILWVGLSWNKSFKVSETTRIYAGASAWWARAEWFVPLRTVSVGAWAEQRINKKRLEKKLDPTATKKIALGANVTLINFIVPTRGVNLWYSIDKMEGIETQYSTIKNQSTQIWIEALTAIKDVFDDREQSLAAIEKMLENKFGKSSVASIHKAAFNLYTWLQAFNLNKEDFNNPSKLYQVATMLGDFYALSWKNTAVTWLNWRFFDGVSIGVQFFEMFFPVPSIALPFAKYKNLYYEDTPESQALADKAEATGDGNKILNIEIGEKEVDLINNTLEIPFKNPKSAINQSEKENINQVSDILFDETNKTIKVPFDLREKNILNVNLDPCLKWHITTQNIEGKEYMIVPSAIPVRLFTENLWTKVVYVLNLGDVKSDGWKKTVVDKKSIFEDVMLRSGANNSIPSDRLWNALTPVFEKTTKVGDIDTLITKLNIGDYKTFPLLSTTKSTEKWKEKQTVFQLRAQSDGGPRYALLSTVWGQLTLNSTQNTCTLAPETGELTINYAKDKNTYIFSYKDQPTDKLRITYKINDLTYTEAQANTWTPKESIIFNDTNKLFEFVNTDPLSEAKTLIENNKTTLKNAERNNFSKFKIFMDNLWKIKDTDKLDQTELNIAKAALLKILWEDNALAKYIITLNNDYQTLAYIMDRMKQIFAMERYQSSLTALWTRRKDIYHDILSPSGNTLPGSITRNLVQNKWNLDEGFDENKSQEYSNLIGYTAFYRKEWSPAWSMTAPGSTTVYNNFISDKLEDNQITGVNQLTDGKKRFLNNLDKQTYEKDLLLAAVQSKISKEYKTQITSDNLLSFLKTGELRISIDNWKKKYILTLESTYHFYLLGECANESLGIKIGGIKIKEYTPWVVTGSESSWDVAYAYDQKNNIGLQINNAQTRNEAFRGKKQKFGLGLALGVIKPKQAETPPAPPPTEIVDGMVPPVPPPTEIVDGVKPTIVDPNRVPPRPGPTVAK